MLPFLARVWISLPPNSQPARAPLLREAPSSTIPADTTAAADSSANDASSKGAYGPAFGEALHGEPLMVLTAAAAAALTAVFNRFSFEGGMDIKGLNNFVHKSEAHLDSPMVSRSLVASPSLYFRIT